MDSSTSMWHGIDQVSRDGWSLSIAWCGTLFILTRHFIENNLMWILILIPLLFVSIVYFLFPYAAKIEQTLFSIKSPIIRRVLIILIKMSAWIIAVTGGMAALRGI